MDVLQHKILGRFFAAALSAAATCASWADLPPLRWSGDIKPGMTESELTSMLKSLGVNYHDDGAGLTYTSSIATDTRDYLFCQDRLYAIVEGVFASGTEFNEWFDAFLSAHYEYGEPERYEAVKDWGRFIAEWKLKDNSVFIFQLQSDHNDKHGWSRQLYSRDEGSSCLEPD